MDTLDDDKLGMTDAQWETFQRLTHGFGEQSEDGTDLSLLRENLTRTPTERLDKLQDMMDFFKSVTREPTAKPSANS